MWFGKALSSNSIKLFAKHVLCAYLIIGDIALFVFDLGCDCFGQFHHFLCLQCKHCIHV